MKFLGILLFALVASEADANRLRRSSARVSSLRRAKEPDADDRELEELLKDDDSFPCQGKDCGADAALDVDSAAPSDLPSDLPLPSPSVAPKNAAHQEHKEMNSTAKLPGNSSKPQAKVPSSKQHAELKKPLGTSESATKTLQHPQAPKKDQLHPQAPKKDQLPLHTPATPKTELPVKLQSVVKQEQTRPEKKPLQQKEKHDAVGTLEDAANRKAMDAADLSSKMAALMLKRARFAANQHERLNVDKEIKALREQLTVGMVAAQTAEEKVEADAKKAEEEARKKHTAAVEQEYADKLNRAKKAFHDSLEQHIHQAAEQGNKEYEEKVRLLKKKLDDNMNEEKRRSEANTSSMIATVDKELKAAADKEIREWNP